VPSPERPFVPRRTPTKAQPALGSADFAVSRPFIPGVEREAIESSGIRRGESPAALTESLPPIERFLELMAANEAGTSESADAALSEDNDVEEDELPPVEHFLDPLPPVGEFAADAPIAEERFDADVEYESDSAAGAHQATDWVETDWQQYDWRSVAALGDSGEHEASTAWAETDWDAGMPHAKENKPTAAQAIATALDQIAQKIRDGELALPGPGTVTDPRTLATTLAALLGIRR